MNLVAVVLLATALVALRMVAAVDLFCDCRGQENPRVTLHCNDTEAENTEVTCSKATAATVPDIPRGYKFVPGYSVVKLYRTFKTWSAAKESCEAGGSRLATPPSSYALDGLKQVFSQEKGIWYAFIGNPEGKHDDSLDANSTQNSNETRENCTILRNDGIMDESPCDSVSPFLCERPMPWGELSSDQWEEDAGRFYLVHSERRTRAQAAEQCRRENASLAVPDTWLRATALLRRVEPSQDLYFVGFTEQAEGDFVTDSGRHLNDMEFQLWGPNQPDNSDGGVEEDCLALTAVGYIDVRCERELPFVCEIVP